MSYPLKVVHSGPDLEMILGYAQVDLRVANHGESLIGPHLRAVAAHAHVLK